MSVTRLVCDTVAARYLRTLSADLDGHLDATLTRSSNLDGTVTWDELLGHVHELRYAHERHCQRGWICLRGARADACATGLALRKAGYVIGYAKHANIERVLDAVPGSLYSTDRFGVTATLAAGRLAPPKPRDYPEGNQHDNEAVVEECWEIAGLLDT